MSLIHSRFSKPLPRYPPERSTVVHGLDALTDDEDDEDDENNQVSSQAWRPPSLKRWYLASLVIMTSLLIAVIIWLSVLSNKNHGIILARDVSALPLGKSFSYLYLPTIVSVLYSFLWAWVDLDVRRLEPYFQLSKSGGVCGDDSVNLAYPLEFLITLPFSALKRRHWYVATTSVTIILVLWGLTPIQAGIFAVRTITIDDTLLGSHSTTYTPLPEQGNTTSIYAQSVYNIAWLNETLPPFMTRDYVLSPFAPAQPLEEEASLANFTAQTTAYSVDVACEQATLWNNSGWFYYNSTGGCSIQAPTFRPLGGNDTSKPYDTIYAGYQNREGFAQYYLEGYCDERFSNLFFVRWSKVTDAYIKTPMNTGSMKPSQALNDTSLFCQASYYQQTVNATISLPANAVLGAEPLGEKMPLPADLFNISTFEWAMNSGQEQVAMRGDYPSTSFPDQKSQLLDMPINLDWVPKMAPFAIAAQRRPAGDYLDPEILRESYESAYRLLFSRQLVGVLDSELDTTTQAVGAQAYVTQAVVVVPGFAYATISVLGAILLLAIGLLVAIPMRTNKLHSDPATLGALMDLTAGQPDISETFMRYDQCDSKALQTGLQHESFSLQVHVGSECPKVRLRRRTKVFPDNIAPAVAPNVDAFDISGVRPFEMRAYIGLIFLTLQVAATVTFAVLFTNAYRSNGLALPSQSTFVRQTLENYIPIALATLIEPFWLILTRLAGMLQPFEELRRGNASTKRSVDLDYASLPPQFLFLRSFGARHFAMMLVCLMALLANVLSVALSGLMYEDTMVVASASSVAFPYSTQIARLNGIGPPFNGALQENSDGSATAEPFYRAMSNQTAGTSMPPWTGENMTYWPVETSSMNTSIKFELETQAMRAELMCQQLNTTGSDRYAIEFNEDASSIKLDVTLNSVNCSNFKPWTRTFAGSGLNSLIGPSPGRQAIELNAVLSTRSIYQNEQDAGRNVTDHSEANDLFCRQHIIAGWIRADWQAVNDTRNSKGNYDLKASTLDSTLVLCRPVIYAGNASAIFDSTGRVIEARSEDLRPNNGDAYGSMTNQSSFFDLVAQANRFLTDSHATWHNDPLPSDYNNYLIEQMRNGSTGSLLDPSSTAPSAVVAAEQYSKVYSRLFSILVSTNHRYLFQPAAAPSAIPITLFTPETRIIFSTPAFIVVEVIFGLYILTTTIFYARRPWRVLPRLPSTVGSQIAFFSGSKTLRDMSEWHGPSKQGRKGWRWGYGKYVAIDGKLRVGIEREPFVQRLEPAQHKPQGRC